MIIMGLHFTVDCSIFRIVVEFDIDTKLQEDTYRINQTTQPSQHPKAFSFRIVKFRNFTVSKQTVNLQQNNAELYLNTVNIT